MNILKLTRWLLGTKLSTLERGVLPRRHGRNFIQALPLDPASTVHSATFEEFPSNFTLYEGKRLQHHPRIDQLRSEFLDTGTCTMTLRRIYGWFHLDPPPQLQTRVYRNPQHQTRRYSNPQHLTLDPETWTLNPQPLTRTWVGSSRQTTLTLNSYRGTSLRTRPPPLGPP